MRRLAEGKVKAAEEEAVEKKKEIRSKWLVEQRKREEKRKANVKKARRNAARKRVAFLRVDPLKAVAKLEAKIHTARAAARKAVELFNELNKNTILRAPTPGGKVILRAPTPGKKAELKKLRKGYKAASAKVAKLEAYRVAFLRKKERLGRYAFVT